MNFTGFMERAMGIEPPSEAWEASILPLYDARPLFFIVLEKWFLNRFFVSTRSCLSRAKALFMQTPSRASKRIKYESRSSIVPNGGRAEGRKIGNIPASSQCFDEEHTRVQATPQDVNGVSLVGELGGLSVDDLEVGVDPAFVTVREKLKRFLR